MTNAITDQDFWNKYWTGVRLPTEIKRDPGNPYLGAILDVFDRYLPVDTGKSALEIGGAPGQYLAYIHRRFGYQVSALDYSEKGCEATRRNLALLGIPGVTYQKDLFGDLTGVPQFDVVYSLGFIEHFWELAPVVGRHIQLLKPGGLLVLGVPNLLGINHFFMRRLAPQTLAAHNCDAMRLARWKEFAAAHRLEPRFLEYVGGFEPAIFCRKEDDRVMTRFWYRVAMITRKVFGPRFDFLRGYNSVLWSGYAIGVFTQKA